MKGIILAGGSGTRLYPLTIAVSKQLMPVYDKPMIYYPLSVLMLSGIREVLIISTPTDIGAFEKLLGDGSEIGMQFTYKVQPKPEGLAQAFILGKEFIGDDNVALILGDNIFYGSSLTATLQKAREQIEQNKGGMIFAQRVSDPERYGVVDFESDGTVKSIEEKPTEPKSSYAVPGLYYYDNEVISIAENLKPSDRGELEITDVNKVYLEKQKLKVSLLDRGIAWFDSGTHASLLQAANFVQTVEDRQGLKIGCIEEVAHYMKYIDTPQLKKLADRYMKSGYGKYLLEIANESN